MSIYKTLHESVQKLIPLLLVLCVIEYNSYNLSDVFLTRENKAENIPIQRDVHVI